MALAWIDDNWIKRADDGTEIGRTLQRKLSAARNPDSAGIPDKFRKCRFGVGKRWRVVWRIPGPDGVMVQKSKSFDSYRDAESYCAAMDDDVRRGRYRDPNDAKRMVSEVATEWFAGKVNIRQSTLNRYKRDYEHYVAPRWGSMPLTAVQPASVQAWIAELQSGTAVTVCRSKVCLSARSIRAIVRIILGGIMDYAVRQGWVDANPVDAVVLPKIASRDEDMVLLDVKSIEALADAAATVGMRSDSRRWSNGLIIRWQAYTGTRIGECFALRVKDVDFDRRRARVRETWSDGDGEPVLTLPKNGRQRTVAWPRFIEDDLHRMCAGRGPDDFLFPAPRGGAWRVRNWRNRVWTPALKAAGLDSTGATIHDLRHSYASLAIRAGADVKTLQAQLGHSSAAMTLDVYAALWPENLGSVADAVNDVLASEAGGAKTCITHTLGDGCPRTSDDIS